MTKLGEVIRGDKLGKKSKEWFIWAMCPNCGLERWIRRGKTELKNYTAWCQICNAKRNNKMRAYYKANSSLAWKGGKTKDHGYVLVLLQPDDFFYSMVNNKGYVREHRLIVAKALKRCLLPWEVVHHKGAKYPLGSIENKQDNRYPENLALLGSNGKHNKEVERLIKQARNEGYKAGREEMYSHLKSELPLNSKGECFYCGVAGKPDEKGWHPDRDNNWNGDQLCWNSSYYDEIRIKLKEWGIK